jgi:hypothetical protein
VRDDAVHRIIRIRDQLVAEITVTLANLPPTVVTDTPSVIKNVASTFDPRANDSDPGGDVFTITAKGTPAHGTVTIGTGGTSLIYTPTNYIGPDSFTYTVTDIDGGTSTGTVNATVRHGLLPPTAVNDNSGVMGGQTRAFDPRLNDSDDSGTITITSKTNGAHGTVTIGGNGTSLSYAAQTGWNGNDTFSYTITDLDGLTGTATVTMSVSTTNRAPTAVADTMSYVGEWVMGESVGFKPSISIDPRWNDTDPDGHTLTVTAKTNGAIGSVVKSGNILTWTKNTNVAGPGTWSDSFTYTISDGYGGTSVGTVNVTVELGCVNGSNMQCP